MDTLIETTLDIDMGTDRKRSLFSELLTMVMDEEERSYIASMVNTLTNLIEMLIISFFSAMAESYLVTFFSDNR
ncbi:hypothetical protein [Vagococcus fluvialis]|uniref:hypothetical protein n=1 Tax=Vagococcus fluvialis TaxID=2738 RepID=UPI003D107C76